MSEIVLFQDADEITNVNVRLDSDTVWLTQKALAELFGVQVPAINKHMKNIFDSGELKESAVISILETTAADSKNYPTRYYNLDSRTAKPKLVQTAPLVQGLQADEFEM